MKTNQNSTTLSLGAEVWRSAQKLRGGEPMKAPCRMERWLQLLDE